jgi:formylglycine-generating enzyme required for sulfatase activity
VVSQGDTVAENSSLQLQGTGCRYESFTWVAVSGTNTKGVVNASQTFSCPAATTLGRPCTADTQCGTGQWCSTVANYRYCAPRLFSGQAHQMDFAFIPAGTNLQGTPGAITPDDERPFTSVISRNYFVSRTEVTQGQWRAVSGGTNPSCFQTTTGTTCTTSNANDNGPVENVDWYSAVAFANALSVSEGLSACYTLRNCTDPTNGWKDGQHSGCTFLAPGTVFEGPSCNGYRLLTESEWERAARAGTTTAYFWGTSTTAAVVNLYTTYILNSGSRTTAVATRQPNLFGLFDTSGNATEWVWDTYLAAYPTGSSTDYVGPTQDNSKVRRSSAFNASLGRTADRTSNGSISRFSYTGLRIARVAP